MRFEKVAARPLRGRAALFALDAATARRVAFARRAQSAILFFVLMRFVVLMRIPGQIKHERRYHAERRQGYQFIQHVLIPQLIP